MIEFILGLILGGVAGFITGCIYAISPIEVEDEEDDYDF